MKKKILLLILSIVTVLTILGSSTYSLLFKENETEVQSYTTGILEITSESINDSVTLTNSLPMEEADGFSSDAYIFKITNTGNLTYQFDVKLLSTTTSNQINSQYIKLEVNASNTALTLSNLTDGVILEDIVLTPGDSYKVILRVWLDYNTPNTQIGKTFNAKVTTEGQAIPMTQGEMTLTMLGLEDSVNEEELVTFTATSESDGTLGIYKTQDDLGTSYYYRGDVENNYVYFAGFYWRIIRINGDGTVRMIYDGTTAHANGESSTDRQVTTIAFNSSYNDNAYVGYMYGTAGASKYAATHANTNNSTIKTYLEDTWYANNIKGTSYEQYIADAIYCNDRSPSTEASSYTGIGTTDTDYAAYQRLYTNKTPTLKCEQENDRFTVGDSIGNVSTNGDLKYPVGLLTWDEAYFSGGSAASNMRYYLYAGNCYWTMSPAVFYGGYADVGNVDSDGYAGFGYFVNDEYCAVRPVISLKSDAIKSGTGTMTNPYLIYEKGDVDRDGIITGEDGNLVGKFVAGTGTLDTEQRYLSECDGSGSIDTMDLVSVLRVASNKEYSCTEPTL